MRNRSTCFYVVAGALFLTAACGPFRKSSESTTSSVALENGAVVLTGAALTDGPGSLLASMSGKVPNFHVRRISGECPQITLRNVANLRGVVNPHVYVDGTRATDTCVLESLRTSDVERVEVYARGYTTRAGYGRNASGLILVFMRSS